MKLRKGARKTKGEAVKQSLNRPFVASAGAGVLRRS
jgi:hypothetical protein